ncbi:MAG: hypothetical protein FWD28_10940 [Treponema sp.]|nr:hypothetical protein [Treponema sp.]
MKVKIYLYTILIIILFAFTSSCLDSNNLLRKPDEKIKEEILALTPIGSSMEDVIRVIDGNEDWLWYQRYIVPRGYPENANYNTFIGSRSIRVILGFYRHGLFSVGVSCYWGFDENDNLLDVRIRKDAR